MIAILVVAFLICLSLLIIGFFSPKTSLFWLKDDKKKKRGLSFIIYFTAMIVLSMLSSLISSEDSEVMVESVTNNTTDSIATTVVEKEIPAYWVYTEDYDQMNEDTIYFATCTSQNTKYFKFPYDGGSLLYLIVRKMNGKNEVLVQISKGQIQSSIGGNEYIRFKFDDNKPEAYYYNNAADGSTNYVFLNQSSKLIAKLRKSKKVKIDLPIFQEGRPVFEFSTEGLEWN